MRTVGSWIRERREALGYRREDLISPTGLSLSTLVRIEQDKTSNRASMLSVGRALRVNPPELLADWADKRITAADFARKMGGGGSEAKPERPKTRTEWPEPAAFQPVDVENGTPILGEVTAGGMVESIVFDTGDQPERVPLIYPGLERVYALRIRGDSMAPEYRPGEILMVRDATRDELEDGEDAVIQCDGGLDGASTFKRVFLGTNGTIKLVPLNSSYKASDCKLEHVIRVGKILGVYRPKVSGRKG
jgi:SOS-response transcriptional repressor LexA